MKTQSKPEFKPDFIDSMQAFDEAIGEEILSAKELDLNFAGNFMYMHTIDKVHYFKNIITRKYGHDKESVLKALLD